MQLISELNKAIRLLLYVIDSFSKQAWAVSLKVKKCITITNFCQKSLDESDRKPRKICVDKGSDFYNRSIKSLLEKHTIKMYSTYNQGKSVSI